MSIDKSPNTIKPTSIQSQNNYEYTILIVEDNNDLRDFLLSILQNNYIVMTASNGKEALSILHNISPDLIISDIVMPEMDGLELTKMIKGDINYSHIPMVLLTAKSDIEYRI